MHVFVGLPPYDGKIHAPTATSLIMEDRLAREAGVHLNILILAGAHYPSHAYNALWAKFLETDAEKFVSVEWDVSWQPGTLLRLLATPHDYVGAATRYKHEPEHYMVGWKQAFEPDDEAQHQLQPYDAMGGPMPGVVELRKPKRAELWTDKYGCMEVDWIPQGLSCSSRAMVEKLWAAAKDREYKLNDGTITRQVFRDGFHRDGFFTQDTRLCEEWREMGGKIHVMPELATTHTACPGHAYTGSLGDWLRRQMKEAA